MPMRKGRSKKTVSSNIREFHGGKTYEHTKKKFGKNRADKQAVAAALSQARRSGRKKPKVVRHRDGSGQVGNISYSQA